MTNTPDTALVHEESTYQLLIQSEEKERGLIEAIVYLLLVVATTTTIWQFSREPVTEPPPAPTAEPTAGKSPYDNFEREMASWLGRPDKKPS